MRSHTVKVVRRAVIGAAALTLVGSVFGLTASNTVPATTAGEGAGTISGYTVSNIAYSLNTSNPSNIDAVDFDLDATPAVGSTLKIKLVSGGGTWYSCTNTGAAVTCDTTSPQATVSAADELRVVVVG